MLGWLCIVQSLLAYTPGIRAGAILLGLPPLVQARMLAVSHTKPLHDAVAQMADDLYGGYAPATPFSINKRFFDKLRAAVHKTVARKAVILFCCLHRSYIITVYCRTVYGKICSYTAGI